MSAPTPRPWTVNRDGSTIWIEGPKGSGASARLPGDRRIVADFRLYGDPDLDAETEANFDLIVRRANGE